MPSAEDMLPVPGGIAAPSQQGICSTELDEKSEILYVRETRLAINRSLMANGQIPDDPDKLDMLMKNLKDMDGSANARLRIKTDEKNSESDRSAMVSVVNQTLLALRGGKALPQAEIVDTESKEVIAPQLPDELNRTYINEGEMKIGTVLEDVDAFKNRMNDKFEKEGK